MCGFPRRVSNRPSSTATASSAASGYDPTKTAFASFFTTRFPPQTSTTRRQPSTALHRLEIRRLVNNSLRIDYGHAGNLDHTVRVVEAFDLHKGNGGEMFTEDFTVSIA